MSMKRVRTDRKPKRAIRSRSAALPNVWGAGQLLAFSGLDGQTNWAEPFVLHTGSAPGSVTVKLPVEAAVAVDGLPELKFRLVLGDVIDAESAQGPFRLAFLDNNTLIGELPTGASLRVAGRSVTAAPAVCAADAKGLVAAAQKGNRWGLYGAPAGAESAAVAHCRKTLTADLDATVAARRALVEQVRVPARLSPALARLLRKAVSVMKVNTHYLICCGLRRYGFNKAAAQLRRQTLAEIGKWYETEGCLFEFYDSLGVTSPRHLDRKQRLISGRGMAPISDYHWTAALTAALILDEG